MEKILVGTAGWTVSSRYRGDFPAAGSQLERYAARLDSVEINSSFYRPHKRETYERWAGSVPAAFRFAVKLPRSITHEQRLEDCEAALDAFLDQAGGLGEKLGVILIQTAPNLQFEAAVVDRFLSTFRERTQLRAAWEPRHSSWFALEAESRLAQFGVSRVAADPARHAEAGEPGGNGGLAYFRFHGAPKVYFSNYPPETLAAIAGRVRQASSSAETWCIFDNTAEGHALGNALAVKAVLEMETPPLTTVRT